MGKIIKNGVLYGGNNTIEVTQAEYDALSQAEKENGTIYFVTDGIQNNRKIQFNIVEAIGTVTVNGKSGAWGQVAVSTNGMTPLGIVGSYLNMSGGQEGFVYAMRLLPDSSNISFAVRNTSSTQAEYQLSVYVLCVEN